MIPVKYNIRNMRVRWVTTALTVFGTGLVVASSCVLFGMVDGLQQSLKVSGDPLDLIILRKGSTNETGSGLDANKLPEVESLVGIDKGTDGKPLCAGELVSIPLCERSNGTRANLIVRGADPCSKILRPDFQIIAERAEKAAVIVTTNMPFSEWPQSSPSPTLQGGARSAHRSGTLRRDQLESYRFRRTLRKNTKE